MARDCATAKDIIDFVHNEFAIDVSPTWPITFAERNGIFKRKSVLVDPGHANYTLIQHEEILKTLKRLLEHTPVWRIANDDETISAPSKRVFKSMHVCSPLTIRRRPFDKHQRSVPI
jgi:hypothetical protein